MSCTRFFIWGRDGSPLPSLNKSGTRRDSRPYPYNKRGMVLFEVIIAMTVFTIAAFALVMALNRCLDGANLRNQVDMVVRGLQNQQALLHGSNIMPGETDAPDDGTGIAYHVSVTQEQQLRDQKGLPIPNMYQVTITATWKAPSGDLETRSVSELVYQP
jgi:Tfp pilus assembly protein PilV